MKIFEYTFESDREDAFVRSKFVLCEQAKCKSKAESRRSSQEAHAIKVMRTPVDKFVVGLFSAEFKREECIRTSGRDKNTRPRH